MNIIELKVIKKYCTFIIAANFVFIHMFSVSNELQIHYSTLRVGADR